MKKRYTLFLCSALLISFASAKPLETETLSYELDGVTFESVLVYPSNVSTKAPGVLMIPNWMGPTEASLEKAKLVAGDSRLVMMVDMYGVDTRPSNGQEAGAAAGTLRGDRDLMRARAQKALEVFRDAGSKHGLDEQKIAAIGFCFGGGAVLELGRTGADLDAIVSFHGDLLSPTLQEDAGRTHAKVLVLHGAEDPYVPQTDVDSFVSVMLETGVDWQLVQFSGTVHSFTNPEADSDGSRYNARSAQRAFEMMNDLLAEVW
ncbi:dienelactone hydrolase family protein [Pelagicoccus sp. SDUM812003]|uniref:dienelactone hydrolase family protein n=1 Tax=Pelagicoccus sp. SDUM812003 TaxID=3041267 RepID=UPI00281028A6|nr:dienelactone hydrolase family protein [Pelagicoccus sp. SDUM812003]MDQ8204581.1 dienelactone hydrolase family protein [Pelagicoccus sp. SDUM812003]